MMRYDAQIVVRCTGKLKREADKFSAAHGANTGEVARRILEKAFNCYEEIPLPPGMKHAMPAQDGPKGKA